MIRFCTHFLVVCFSCLFLLATSSAHAQITNWTGNFGQDWSDPSNWDNGIAGSGDTAVFGGGAGTTNVLLQGNQTVNDLNFTSADAYTFDSGLIGFNTLTLESGNITSVAVSDQTLSNNVELGAAGTWDLERILTLEGSLFGPFDLIKTGDGELSLTGDNSGFANNIAVSGGILVLNGTDAISDATTITLPAPAELSVVGGEQIGGLAGTGGFVNLGAVLTVGVNNLDTLYADEISGGSALDKTGFGKLTLTGDVTTANTTIVSGQLQIGNGGTSGSISGDISNNEVLFFKLCPIHRIITSDLDSVEGGRPP